jgi:O-antigen/teichoic acid export membrane protein
MFRNILHTVATRAISAVLSFVLIILVTNFLGAQGKGEISLFLLNLTILILFSQCVGGPALVYTVPEIGLRRSLPPSYLWGIASVLLISFGLFALQLQSGELLIHLILIGILEVIGTIQTNALFGKKRIARSNLAQLAQAAVLLMAFASLLLMGRIEVMSYIYGLYLAVIVKIVIAFPAVKEEQSSEDVQKVSFWKDMRFILRFGALGQLGNVAQLLNYRLAFYYLEYRTDAFGTVHVGIFSTALHIVEAMWLVSRSIATVQYAEIANLEDKKLAYRTTERLHRFNFILMAGAIVPVLLIPSELYVWLFGSGQGFEQIRILLIWLIPGLVAIPLSTSFSHHFSGKGKPEYNLYASGLGLVATALLGAYWIPLKTTLGAAQVSSVAYLIVYGVMLSLYMRMEPEAERRLLPKASDIKDVTRLLREKIL